MLLGIDVGGTFTDGVVIDGERVAAAVKRPTDEQDLRRSLWAVLDELLTVVDKAELERVVFSTTLITNLLATGRGERTALLLIPGHGLPPETYALGGDSFFLTGAMDFRGREIEKMDENEVRAALAAIHKRGIRRVAIAGKFSSRNAAQERAVRRLARQDFPELDLYLSSEIAGRLNFPRRAATAYYTAMIRPEWQAFADETEAALQQRGISAPLEVLKADGGTMSLTASRNHPCETIFSGPAASTMGALALAGAAEDSGVNSVVIDIGGTTSDLALLVEGKPLYASRGAEIAGRLTHVRSLLVHSVPLGGDSALKPEAAIIQAYRSGPAACFGGSEATVIDAFNWGLNLNIGTAEASRAALTELAEQLQLDLSTLCAEVIQQTVQRLQTEIEAMFKRWEQEPAYKVWEVVHQKRFVLHSLIGIGAAAEAITPRLAQALGVECRLPAHAAVANGLGAALVRPTLAVEVHIDTERGSFAVNPEGRFGSLTPGRFQLAEARDFARSCLEQAMEARGMKTLGAEAVCYMEEQFNVVRAYSTVGKIFDVAWEIAPGFVPEFSGVII